MTTALPTLLFVFGTRPEAIKMAPVIRAVQADGRMQPRICLTAQHRGLLDQVMDVFGLAADIDLDLMQPGQTLEALTARLLTALGGVIAREAPACVVVQGDTASAMVGALSAYYARVPVAHVEAGLRSGDIYSPFPEEVNRRIVGTIAHLHFPPTETAAAALRAETVDPARIHVTGNTVIDALLATRARIVADPALAGGVAPLLSRFVDKRLILVTSHRRENFGGGMAAIARAVARIAARDDVAVLFPVHPNPEVRRAMEAELPGRANVALVEPLDYPGFIAALDACHIVLTDSGGVQEEAPALGKPVLVMRDTTERPEGVAAGTAKLIGADEDRIVSEIFSLLDDEAAYQAMARAHNPFGDGHASARIVRALADDLGL